MYVYMYFVIALSVDSDVCAVAMRGCMSCLLSSSVVLLLLFLSFVLSSCSFYKRIISADALSAISTICGVALLRSAGEYKVIMA